MDTTRDLIERQKERLDYIHRDTRQFEEKISDILSKIQLFEEELFSDTLHGRRIPALVRENIGISVEIQLLEYEMDMRQSVAISRPTITEPVQQPARSNPVILDIAEYPYAHVVPPSITLSPHSSHLSRSISHSSYPVSVAGSLNSINPNCGISSSSSTNSTNHSQYNLGTPTVSTSFNSPSIPTNIVFQSSPNELVSTSGEMFNISHHGSLNHIQPNSDHLSPVPERPTCLPLSQPSNIPRRPAPPPPSSIQRGNHVIFSNQSGHDGDDGKKWECLRCSFQNHSALIYCEICETGRIAPQIGNIYTTFSSLYPKETSALSTPGSSPLPSSDVPSGSGSSTSSPKLSSLLPSTQPAFPPVHSSSSLGSPPASSKRHHKSRPHLPSFGKKKHTKNKDKRGDKC